MKKKAVVRYPDALRPEYDLLRMRGGARGKHYLALIDPELAQIFPDSGAVNRALRVLVDAGQVAAPHKRRRVRVG